MMKIEEQMMLKEVYTAGKTAFLNATDRLSRIVPDAPDAYSMDESYHGLAQGWCLELILTDGKVNGAEIELFNHVFDANLDANNVQTMVFSDTNPNFGDQAVKSITTFAKLERAVIDTGLVSRDEISITATMLKCLECLAEGFIVADGEITPAERRRIEHLMGRATAVMVELGLNKGISGEEVPRFGGFANPESTVWESKELLQHVASSLETAEKLYAQANVAVEGWEALGEEWNPPFSDTLLRISTGTLLTFLSKTYRNLLLALGDMSETLQIQMLMSSLSSNPWFDRMNHRSNFRTVTHVRETIKELHELSERILSQTRSFSETPQPTALRAISMKLLQLNAKLHTLAGIWDVEL